MPTATKPHTTRRKFLAYGAASVAGALAPAFIPSSALGAGASVSPSNRIVLGLIGMGKMMSYHHRMMLARPEVHVAALCDVESERLALQQTRNHQAYAERLGKPKAVRAVAGACAANRLAIAVPCHRIVRSDGGLGGYRWGIERKAALLGRERDLLEP